jgi:hypothetical protein
MASYCARARPEEAGAPIMLIGFWSRAGEHAALSLIGTPNCVQALPIDNPELTDQQSSVTEYLSVCKPKKRDSTVLTILFLLSVLGSLNRRVVVSTVYFDCHANLEKKEIQNPTTENMLSMKPAS